MLSNLDAYRQATQPGDSFSAATHSWSRLSLAEMPTRQPSGSQGKLPSSSNHLFTAQILRGYLTNYPRSNIEQLRFLNQLIGLLLLLEEQQRPPHLSELRSAAKSLMDLLEMTGGKLSELHTPPSSMQSKSGLMPSENPSSSTPHGLERWTCWLNALRNIGPQ